MRGGGEGGEGAAAGRGCVPVSRAGPELQGQQGGGGGHERVNGASTAT